MALNGEFLQQRWKKRQTTNALHRPRCHEVRWVASDGILLDIVQGAVRYFNTVATYGVPHVTVAAYNYMRAWNGCCAIQCRAMSARRQIQTRSCVWT